MAAAQSIVLRTERDAQRLWGVLKGWLSMADLGKPIAVEVSEYHAKRSSQANRRYWALVKEISENAWLGGRKYSKDAWHEHLKREILGTEEVVLPSGEIMFRGISTSNLNTAEFSEFLESAMLYAQQHLGMECA